MANVSVLNMEGKEVGSMELNDAVFGVEINEHLVHQAVVLQLANNRQGTQKAKTRSEVSAAACGHLDRVDAEGLYLVEHIRVGQISEYVSADCEFHIKNLFSFGTFLREIL